MVSASRPAAQFNSCARIIRHHLAQADGWLPFDRYMALALYAPGLGYYANASRKFGAMPASGSDFVTAPEMTPLFGQTLAAQLAQALQATQTHALWEFGAGSGALADQILRALDPQLVRSYTIVELSASLRARQQALLKPFADRVRWIDALPASMEGVVIGNEVLDAMPVKLLRRADGVWCERGVALQADTLVFADRPTALRPTVAIEGTHDYLCEIHPHAQAFVRTLADRLTRGAAFFVDYGFPEHEYYHPQRHMGTLMCHRGHLADGDPLAQSGEKDITAHVNFSAIALAAQEAGLATLGYTSQARFLINNGLVARMEQAPLAEKVAAQRLIVEHEMGELFKVLGLYQGPFWEARGFCQGDRTHTL